MSAMAMLFFAAAWGVRGLEALVCGNGAAEVATGGADAAAEAGGEGRVMVTVVVDWPRIPDAAAVAPSAEGDVNVMWTVVVDSPSVPEALAAALDPSLETTDIAGKPVA